MWAAATLPGKRRCFWGLCREGVDVGPWPQSRREHVAIPDRQDCGCGQHRSADRNRDHRLSGSPEGQLERVRWRNRVLGAETEKPIRNVFIFIGADPATGWLKDCGVGLDAKGFVRTGAALSAAT